MCARPAIAACRDAVVWLSWTPRRAVTSDGDDGLVLRRDAQAVADERAVALLERFGYAPAAMSRAARRARHRAVIAVATIGRSVDDYALDTELGAQRRWYFWPIGYVLRDLHALPAPVACRGWQGFWTLSPDIKARVVAQLSRAS
jgi:hypothetical protein